MKKACAFVLALASTALADAAQTPPIRIMVGGTLSRGLGEQSFAPFVRLNVTADFGRLRLEVAPFYEHSHKYTGQGYIVGVDGSGIIAAGNGLLVIGRLDAHHRNSGSFSKDVMLAGGGLGWEFASPTTTNQVRLTAVTEIAGKNSDNRIRQYQLGYRMYGPAGRIRFSMDVAGTFQQFHNTAGGSAASGWFLQAAGGIGF